MPNLNPRQAGGIEPVEGVPFAIASATVGTLSDLDSDSGEESEEEGVPAASTSAPLAPKKLAKGEGRIERDENGKIVRVVFGGEDGEEVQQDVVERVRGEGESDEDSEEGDSSDEEMEVAKPWGEAMEEWDGEGSEEEELLSEEELGPRSVGQGIPIGVKRRKVVAKTDVVRGALSFFVCESAKLTWGFRRAELETLATRQTKVIRHTSALEGDWLISLVSKYGDDADKMARDRKVNVWQKTAGEIKRACVFVSPSSRARGD